MNKEVLILMLEAALRVLKESREINPALEREVKAEVNQAPKKENKKSRLDKIEDEIEEETKEEAPEPLEKIPTKEELMQAFKDFIARQSDPKKGRLDAKKILKRHGATNISELDVNKYVTVLNILNAG